MKEVKIKSNGGQNHQWKNPLFFVENRRNFRNESLLNSSGIPHPSESIKARRIPSSEEGKHSN
jgi:hypothetical protein